MIGTQAYRKLLQSLCCLFVYQDVFSLEPPPSFSSQVVFQSSTVGVLLADPTQAKVKVKYEGKAAGEPDDDTEQNYVSISCLFDKKTGVIKSTCKLTLKVLDAHLSSVVRLSICTYISAYKNIFCIMNFIPMGRQGGINTRI